MIPYRSTECEQAMRKVKHIAWFPPDVDWKKEASKFGLSFVAVWGVFLFFVAMWTDTTLK